MFYLAFSILFLICLGLLFLLRKKEALSDKVIKIITIIFMSFMFLNVFLPDSFVVSLSREELEVNNNIFEAIVRWLRYVGFLVIPIAVFKKKNLFVKIAIYFVLPMAILNLVLYFMYLPDITTQALRGVANIRFLNEEFRSFISNEMFRSLVFGVISLLEIIILIYIGYKNINKLKFEGIKDIVNFIFILLGLIVISLPIYIPQYLIGYTNIIFDRYSFAHLGWLVSLLVTFILLHVIFKDKPYDDKFTLAFVMSLGLLLQYNQMFAAINELTFQRMPFQLCNIGSYLILITLLTKNEKLFSFTLVVNVVGALIALGFMDVDGEGIGYLWNMHFILEHSGVMLIPLLCLSLKVFPALKKNDLWFVLLGFTIYFLVVLSLGTEVNSIYKATGNDFFKANYLFMFDGEKAYDFSKALGALFKTEIRIGSYTYYPVIQTAVFFIFNVLCVGIFYLLYGLTHIKKERL